MTTKDTHIGEGEIEVTVTKNLNVRIGSPSVNAECHVYLAPNSKVVVKDKLFDGDTYQNVDQWLSDSAGNYYWVGGTNYLELKTEVEPTASYGQAWVKKLSDNMGGIPKTTNEEVCIAVIDSGVSHSHIRDLNVIGGASYLNENEPKVFSTVPVDETSDLHGTGMCAIIKRLCPSAKIISFQVADKDGDVSDSALKKAVEELIRAYKETDHPLRKIGLPTMVNMSISCSSRNVLIDYFNEKFGALKSLGMELIVAAGNDAELKRNLYRSARSSDTLRVATFSQDEIKEIFESSADRPDVCFYNQAVEATINDTTIGKYFGCSPYTAICTGLLARKVPLEQILTAREQVQQTSKTNSFKPYYFL